jgi:hypothetical protein
MITEILNNPKSEFFFSFLVGAGLMIMLFHRPVDSRRSLGIDPNALENVVKADGKCYKYRVEDSTCKNKSSR